MARKKKPLLDWRWVLGATLLPPALAGLYLLLALIMSQPAVRYDPQYFTEPYLETYQSPSNLIIVLEQALRSDDRALMAELHGLRRQYVFEARENMRVTILYGVNEPYFNYLFFDTRTYERFAHHLEQVGGRWVVAPEDLVYYYRSGMWWRTFLPLAVWWWLIEILVVLVMLAYRITRGWEREMLPASAQEDPPKPEP